jgi:hypothetical protein
VRLALDEEEMASKKVTVDCRQKETPKEWVAGDGARQGKARRGLTVGQEPRTGPSQV